VPTLCQSEAGWEHFPHDADVGVRGRGPTAAKEIAFGDHSDQMTVLVDHRQSADPPLQHGPNGLEYCGIRLDRHDRRGHYVLRLHDVCSFDIVQAGAKNGANAADAH
jgi:hypothetical protein